MLEHEKKNAKVKSYYDAFMSDRSNISDLNRTIDSIESCYKMKKKKQEEPWLKMVNTDLTRIFATCDDRRPVIKDCKYIGMTGAGL